MDNFDEDLPLIVAGDEVAVRELAEMACDAVRCTSGLQFDLSCPDGPLRRTADTSRSARLCPDHEARPLKQAIREPKA